MNYGSAPSARRQNGLTFKVKMIKSSDTLDVNSAEGTMAFQPNDDAAWISLFRQHMDEMFSYMFRTKEQGSGQREFLPHMDIYESSAHYVVELDLPGFSENDFNVTTAGSSLRIEGIKRQEKTESAFSYICLERHFGRFSRTVEIPAAFNPDGIRTVYERGVLSIRVPKKQ